MARGGAPGRPLVLGLDVGTQSVKALCYDVVAKQVVGRGSHGLELKLDPERPGLAEQRPQDWVEGVVAASRSALRGLEAADVVGIGVSGQQHGLVALDAQGEVVRDSKLWCDTESAAEAQELSRGLPYPIGPSFTLSKLLWLKRHEPESWARMASFALPHDYINLWLTGRLCMEASDASGIGCLDVRARAWDTAAARLVDPKVAAALPELVGPDAAIGRLRPEAAEALGLGPGREVLVAPGGGDNAMSALGAGLVQDGQAVLSLGTSGTLFCHARRPVVDAEGIVAPFCDATGAWLPLVCTLNCTGATEEVRSLCGLGLPELTALAEAVEPGCGGVNFLPYLMGARTPNWPGASGALLGLRPGSLRPGVLFRAAMEGATYSLLNGARRVEDLGGAIKELRLVGGGAQNPLWRQIVADAFQVPVRCLEEAENAALGAALQAAAIHEGVAVKDYIAANPPPVSAEPVLPDPGKAAAHQAAFARHVELGTTLFDG